MGKVFTVANRKGGCSKTTTVGATASYLHKMGLKVLCIDTDPQGNLTNWSGLRTDIEGFKTIHEALKYECSPEEAIYEIENRYHLMPANSNLFKLEAEINNEVDRFIRLDDVVEAIKDKYDVVFIDTPPNLGTLTMNAFVAAKDGILLTSDTSPFASQGGDEMSRTLESVRKRMNPNAKIIGILLTKFNGRTNAHKVLKDTNEQWGKFVHAPVYKTLIRQSVSVTESQIECVDLMSMQKTSAAIEDYKNFAIEFAMQQGLIDGPVEEGEKE